MIYLDNNATTFIDPIIREYVQKLLREPFGNASSVHAFGRHSRSIITSTEQIIASHFKVKESEIVFTSGATEALNMLILGFGKKRGHIISSQLEHASVLIPLQQKEQQGWRVTYLSPDPQAGAITPQQLEEALADDTALIVLGSANSETGIKTDIEAMAAIAKRRGIHFLVDSVGSFGRDSYYFYEGISATCFSGHKIHAPFGIGCALVRKNFPFQPLIWGGGQQRGRRSGTENILGIAALGCAIEQIEKALPESTRHVAELRDYFESEILKAVPDAIVHGKNLPRVCNTSSIAFRGQEGESLIIKLDMKGIAASFGTACASGGLEPSRALLSMNISKADALSTVRFSLSRFTTREDIQGTIKAINEIIA